MATSIKFNLYNVTNANNKAKAKVSYSLDNRVDERKCVTIYGKSVLENLYNVFPISLVENDSDSMTDYFESDQVTLFEDSPFYDAARLAANRLISKRGF